MRHHPSLFLASKPLLKQITILRVHCHRRGLSSLCLRDAGASGDGGQSALVNACRGPIGACAANRAGWRALRTNQGLRGRCIPRVSYTTPMLAPFRSPIAWLILAFALCPSLFGQAQPIITGIFGGAPSIVAPGEVTNIFGTNLGNSTSPASTVVSVNGVTALSYFDVMYSDVNFQVPPQTPLGVANVVVSVNGVASAPFEVTVQAYSPAFITTNGGFAALANPDGTEINPEPTVTPGAQVYISLTGLGASNSPPTPAITIGGFPASVASLSPVSESNNAGLPGNFVVLFTVPPSLTSGDQVIAVSVGGFSSQTRLISVVATGLILSQTGATFQAVAGSATTFQQNVFIIAASQVTSWTATASTISGGNWLQVTPATGTSDPSQSPPSIQISASAQNLAPGSYYGQVTISPVDTNSAQTITVVLNVLPQGQFPGESLQPTGLLFTSTAGAASPNAQSIQITNPSTVTLSFSGTASVPSGSPWFQFTPEKGTVAPGAPVTITVQPSTSLPAGIYPGSINYQFSDGSRRVLSLLWVVASTGSASGSIRKPFGFGPPSFGPLDTTTCTPTQLVPQFTELGINFSSPVAWPTLIQASIVDNCGNPMTSGSVTLSFSDGDPPLGMSPVQDGTWTATWTPINPVSSSLVVTLTAQLLNPPIQGTTQVSGATPANPLVPIVNSGGVVSTASYAASPAPGTLISIFGTQLAGSTVQATSLPLPDQLGASELTLGSVNIPLLFVSETQINALVPYGLQTKAKYTVIVERGTAISTPQTISVQDALPGIFTPDQSGKGQGYIFKIASDGAQTLAATGAPATAGDVLTIYCAGLGDVQPSLQAGMPAPSTTLEYTVNPVTATIGGVSANVAFGGLTPGFVGLYQVNLTVPKGVIPGDSVPVILSVAGQSSVPVTMAVH